ncbi:glutamine amidotransferase [Bacillus sp. TS-2]|nr:glutamine amidotransferase [Bacillus sp. TS-2]
MVTIGVLALQGAVREHIKLLEKIGVRAISVKDPIQLDEIDGLILPGGESTTMRKLIDRYHFFEPIQRFGLQGKPIFGTCAGLILMSTSISGDETKHFGFINMNVERNAFGRQKESFEAKLSIKNVGEEVDAVFIRAPLVKSIGEGVEIVATFENEIVAVLENHYLACSFHPELTEDIRLHKYFINIVITNKEKTII